MFAAVVMLLLALAAAILLWTIIKQLFGSPGSISRFFQRRRNSQGLEALSGGMIAVAAGDRSAAARYALQARRALPNEPLTDLLRAQAAQLAGDRATSRRIYEGMLAAPDTELLGLRGLFLEASRENESVAARQFAEKALKLNPKLSWSGEGLLALQSKNGDWQGAMETLAMLRKHDHIDKKSADRKRAVLLVGQAMRLEDSESDKALQFATEAHELAPELVPAAILAGRLAAARGNASKVTSIVARAWKKNPHPELAVVYAFAKPGNSVRDRLKRVKDLAAMAPANPESRIAIAAAAIEAREWADARAALEPLITEHLTARVCLLMARLEGGDRQDAGRVREWLARAVHAPRDPAWVADGVVSERWAPVSPVTGALDAFQWKVPDARADSDKGALLIEELRPPEPFTPMVEPPEVREVRPASAGGRAAADITDITEPETATEPKASASGSSGQGAGATILARTSEVAEVLAASWTGLASKRSDRARQRLMDSAATLRAPTTIVPIGPEAPEDIAVVHADPDVVRTDFRQSGGAAGN